MGLAHDEFSAARVADSGWWVSMPAPGWIDMADVRQVEAATRALRSRDHQDGGRFCRDAVVAQLSWGQRLLNSSDTEAVRRRLNIALADLHNLAGWTSFDVGQIDSARNHFGRALALVKASESDELVANILIGRTRDQLGRVNHGEAPDWVKFFDEGDVRSMIDTIHKVLGPQDRDGEPSD